MKNIINTILFDKYKVLRLLGQGSFGSVYLVRHLSLDQDRAIKIIPHDHLNSESTLFEAKLLKSFNHPCIPQIFDIEEDESNFYIVEEYIQGESLNQFLLHQPIISTSLFLSISKQLCDIFVYLHTFQPRPVVYRDLKPEHIIVCGDQIKLIDFGISTYVSKKGNNFRNMGNLEYSAPESILGNESSTAADIYSIGKTLQYMSKHLQKEPSPHIHHIIQKSTKSDPALRYETVEELLSELEKEITNSSGSHLVKSIAVVGSFSGCGTTHIAVSITSYLNYQGYSAVYIDKTDSCNLHSVPEYDPGFYEKDGWIHCKLFRGLPFYGPGIKIDPPSGSTTVLDFGSAITDEILETDLLLLICGGAIWNRRQVLEAIHQLKKMGVKPIIVANHCDGNQAVSLAKAIKERVFCYPFDPYPFKVSRDKLKLLTQLLNQKGESLSFFKRKRRTKHHVS